MKSDAAVTLACALVSAAVSTSVRCLRFASAPRAESSARSRSASASTNAVNTPSKSWSVPALARSSAVVADATAVASSGPPSDDSPAASCNSPSTSAISAGSWVCAAAMLVSALSIASRSMSAWEMAPSAERIAATAAPCSPTGRAIAARPWSALLSANPTSWAARSTLCSIERSVGAPYFCVSVASWPAAPSRRARSATSCCVICANRLSALINRLRISSKAETCSSSAASTSVQVVMICTSIERRSSGVSGMSSSSRCRSENDVARPRFAASSACVKGAVWAGPNSSTASRSSSSLVRIALSVSVKTSRDQGSRTSIGCDSSWSPVSSCSRTESSCDSSFCLRRRRE